MQVKILSIDEKIYEGKCNAVILPAKEGEVQILENHAPYFTLLNKGKIVFDNGKKFLISSGMANVINNKITVLVDKL